MSQDITCFSFKENLYLYGETSLLSNEDISNIRKDNDLRNDLEKNERIEIKMSHPQKSMIFDEMLNSRQHYNTIFYLLQNTQVPKNLIDACKKSIQQVFAIFPLINSKIIEKDVEFYFSIGKIFNASDYIVVDDRIYSDEEDLHRSYKNSVISVFSEQLFRIIFVHVAGGTKIALLFHHILVDVNFQKKLIKTIELLSSGDNPDSLTDFLICQQNWNIECDWQLYRKSYEEYWVNLNSRFCGDTSVTNKGFSNQVFFSESIIYNCKRTYSQYLSTSDIVFSASQALTKHTDRHNLLFLIAINYRNEYLGRDFSGFYTGLVPFPISLNDLSFERINTDYHGLLFNSNLPIELINNSFNTKSFEEKILINLIRLGDESYPAVSSSRVVESRAAMTIKIFQKSDFSFDLYLTAKINTNILNLIAQEISKCLENNLAEYL
jgi:hypothetical protein